MSGLRIRSVKGAFTKRGKEQNKMRGGKIVEGALV